MIPTIIARIFAFVSGLFALAGIAVIFYYVAFSTYTPSSPGSAIDGKNLVLYIVGIAVPPTLIGTYLFYCYVLLSLRRQTYFKPRTIWIVTAVFNFPGILWVPIWPVVAVVLSIVAIVKLKKEAEPVLPANPLQH